MWFPAGTFGGIVGRTCTIPAGKAIFFPVINSLSWSDDTSEENVAQLRDWSRIGIDHVADLQAALDGVPITGLTNFRFMSDLFPVAADPVDPVWPVVENAFGISNGCWLMLEPLSPGQHRIEFRGKWVIPGTFPTTEVFETGVNYHLTVE